jgi:hypothetical protein
VEEGINRGDSLTEEFSHMKRELYFSSSSFSIFFSFFFFYFFFFFLFFLFYFFFFSQVSELAEGNEVVRKEVEETQKEKARVGEE